MTALEQIKIGQLQKEIQELSDRITPLEQGMSDIKCTTDKIHKALVGDEYTTDGGLVGRLDQTEKEVERVTEVIDSWKNKMWGMGIALETPTPTHIR